MDASVTGINVKIGADLTDLKEKLGQVGESVKTGLNPAADTTKDLKDNLTTAATKASLTAVNITAIAVAAGKVGKALIGFSKGILEDALAVNDETKAKVDGVADAFDQMKVTLGESLLPLIDEWAPKLTSTLNSITARIDEHPATAQNIMLIVTAIGGLTSVIAIAAPALTLFNISLAPISGTALAVVGGIVGLITIIGLLGNSLDEVGQKATEASEKIASLDSTSESASFNNLTQEWEFNDHVYVPVELVDAETGETVTKDARWDPEAWNSVTGDLGVWVTQEEDLANAAAGAASALEDQATAVASVTENVETAAIGETLAEPVETTKTAAEQAQEVLESMQTSLEGLGQSADTNLTESVEQLNSVLENEAFLQFTQMPISEDVAGSWSTFGTSVSSASGGFEGLEKNLGGGAISSLLDDAGGAANAAAGSFYALAEQIYGVVDAYLYMNRVMNGGGSGGGNGRSEVEFRASGGTALQGNAYIVGELGPELFIPSTSGTIIPNDEIGGGSGNSVTVNFNGDVIGDERTLSAYVTRAVKRGIREEVYAGG